MLSKSSACVKYLLIFFNIVFFITGVILIAVGASVLGYYTKYDLVLEERYFTAAHLLIATGSIILIVSFFGCCGAAKEHYCMTMTFAGFLILICILELAAGIAGYVLRNEAESGLEGAMLKDIKEANADRAPEKMVFWDDLQLGLHCCGANNYTDWTTKLPSSCCGFSKNETCSIEEANQEGCTHLLVEYVQDHALSIGGVGIGIAFIQFVGIILSCYLGRAIHSEYETV